MRSIAILELIIATMMWGFAFTGTQWVLKFVGGPALLFYRFFLSFLFGFIIFFLYYYKKKHKKKGKDFIIPLIRKEMLGSFVPGVLLGGTLGFQTWGLYSTTATQSAFITSLYAVIVPILQYKTISNKLNWLLIIIALYGTYLISDIKDGTWLSAGNTITLIGSFFASFHILAIGRKAQSTSNVFLFNTFQSFWASLFFLMPPLSTMDSRWSLNGMDSRAFWGLGIIVFGATLLGLSLQINAQKKISSYVASVLFLLEAPFSFLFSFLLSGERMTFLQTIGAILIFIACFLASKLSNITKLPPFPSVSGAFSKKLRK